MFSLCGPFPHSHKDKYMNTSIVSASQELVSFKKIEDCRIPVTTSLIISETFEKPHNDVLKSIRSLIDCNKLGLGIFSLSSYKNSQNKRQPMYLLDEDFTMILVMGFTGEKALDWKIRFKDEFKRLCSIVQRQTGDYSAELNKLYMDVVKSRLEEQGIVPDKYHYMDKAVEVNMEVFGEPGLNKELRQNMTHEQQRKLNKTIADRIRKIVL